MATKKVEVKKDEELVVCEACGKKHAATLDICPKCGYSALDNKKTFYDDEDDDVEVSFEEYDDEDDEDLYEEPIREEDDEEVIEEPKKEDKPKKVKEKVGKEEKKESKKDTKKDTKKDAKKDTKKAKYIVDRTSIGDQNEDLFNFIKIIICIVLLVVVFYLIYAAANGEFKKEEETVDEEVVETIQNEKILASSIFNKADDEYFVLIYDTSDVWADYYTMVYEEYMLIEDEDVLPIFIVDLSNKFNEDIIAAEDEETNPDAQKYSELKVSNPTLIRIKDGENARYYEGDKVVDKLSREIKKFNE